MDAVHDQTEAIGLKSCTVLNYNDRSIDCDSTGHEFLVMRHAIPLPAAS